MPHGNCDRNRQPVVVGERGQVARWETRAGPAAADMVTTRQREKGERFSFPGGPSFVWESADAECVAEAIRRLRHRGRPVAATIYTSFPGRLQPFGDV